LTEKKGVFWGCFAEKRGSARKKIALYFVFSRLFGIIAFCKALRRKEKRRREPSKKNRA
jgi:hypothetical protein